MRWLGVPNRHLEALALAVLILVAISTGVAAAHDAESAEVNAAQSGQPGEVRFVIPISSPTQVAPGARVVPAQGQSGFDDQTGLDKRTEGPSMPFTGSRLLGLVVLGLLLLLLGMAIVRGARRRSAVSAGHLAELGP